MTSLTDDFIDWFRVKGYKLLWITSALTWALFFTILYLKANYPPKVCCCTCEFNNTDYQCGLSTSNNLFIKTLFGFENCSLECFKRGMVLLRELNSSEFNDLVKFKQFPNSYNFNRGDTI